MGLRQLGRTAQDSAGTGKMFPVPIIETGGDTDRGWSSLDGLNNGGLAVDLPHVERYMTDIAFAIAVSIPEGKNIPGLEIINSDQHKFTASGLSLGIYSADHRPHSIIIACG